VGPAGAAGGAPFDAGWRIDADTGFGNGTYRLIVGGLNPTLRLPVMLPRDCARAGLRAATLGTPGSGQAYTFEVLRTAGPTWSPSGAQREAASACRIDAASRACASEWPLDPPWQAGDAIEVQMTGTQALADMAQPGAFAVAFHCE